MQNKKENRYMGTLSNVGGLILTLMVIFGLIFLLCSVTYDLFYNYCNYNGKKFTEYIFGVYLGSTLLIILILMAGKDIHEIYTGKIELKRSTLVFMKTRHVQHRFLNFTYYITEIVTEKDKEIFKKLKYTIAEPIIKFIE